MKPKLNREYAIRHLSVAALFFAMGCWFLFDGAVRYPRQDDAFFAGLHHVSATATPPAEMKRLRDSSIARQYQFAGILLFFALVIGGRVGLEARRRFDFGKEDVEEIDFRKWDSKRIARAKLKNGRVETLDGWHFTGIREFCGELGRPVPEESPPAGT